MSSRPSLVELPEWAEGTVAVLSTGGGPPHAIPVSTALRAGPSSVVLALALRRASLARLRAEPAVALSLFGPGVACTALGHARIVRDPMTTADRVAAVRIDVDEIQDHRQPTFTIDAGIAWRWTDDDAQARDAALRAELRALAGEARG